MCEKFWTLPFNDKLALDSDGILNPVIVNMTSVVKIYQAWLFKDLITGESDIPIPQSGFLRTYSVTKPEKGTTWKYTILNKASSTKGTKLGIDVSAGTSDPDTGVTQSFDVKVEGKEATITPEK